MSYNEFNSVRNIDFLRFGGGFSPSGPTVTEYSEYVTSDVTLSAEEASNEARKQAEFEKLGACVISENEILTLLPNGALCTVELILETDIASEKEILTDN